MIVPAIAGPFDLGVVVIRQALFIDPNTAQVTDVSDPFPTMKDGIPLRIRAVDVNMNRPEFTLNPTSCSPKTINATATSIAGTPAALSSASRPAAVRPCRSTPLHRVHERQASKVNGASFHVKIGFHPGEADIHKVELTIPPSCPRG